MTMSAAPRHPDLSQLHLQAAKTASKHAAYDNPYVWGLLLVNLIILIQ